MGTSNRFSRFLGDCVGVVSLSAFVVSCTPQQSSEAPPPPSFDSPTATPIASPIATPTATPTENPTPTAAPTAAPPSDVMGKVTVGYQGWFSALEDGNPRKSWIHWSRGTAPSPNNQTFELWPDVRECMWPCSMSTMKELPLRKLRKTKA